MQARWNDLVIADSDDTRVAEGLIYFPPESIVEEYFEKRDAPEPLPEGEPQYYDIVHEDDRLEKGAWAYPNPQKEARHLAGYVTFSDHIEVGN